MVLQQTEDSAGKNYSTLPTLATKSLVTSIAEAYNSGVVFWLRSLMIKSTHFINSNDAKVTPS